MFVRIIFIVSTAVALKTVFSNAFNIEKDLTFRLYTRNNPEFYYALNANVQPFLETTFDPQKPTIFFVHGFRSKEKVIKRYSEAYLRLGDYNLIAVDWVEGASTYNYFGAKGHVKDISRKLAELIDALVVFGMRLDDVTIVGHSLGSHIAGRAAKQLKSPGKIACIIGLDPASVGYDFFETSKRLAHTDAEYVQVIHTDGDKFGFGVPLGHADFYPNGGKNQPGCPLRNKLTNLVEKCSHVRSHHLFLESLVTNFTAIQCVSYEEIQRNECTFSNTVGIMGGDITKNTTKPYGIYYLETKLTPPYLIEDYRAFNNIEFIGYDSTHH